MQYTIVGSDGKEYGPVDLMTLKQWAEEGRVVPDAIVVDNLSNQRMKAADIEELGLGLGTPSPHSNYQVPPQVIQEYPRDQQATPYKQPTKLWSILFWLALAVVLSMFTRSGGIILTGLNLFDAYQAKVRRDPNAGLCIGIAVFGFIGVAVWTYIKYKFL